MLHVHYDVRSDITWYIYLNNKDYYSWSCWMAFSTSYAVSTFQIRCTKLSFVLENSWWADNQSSSITKGNTYYIKHMYIQPFSVEVDWREIWHQVGVSTMFYFVDTAFFTLWDRYCITNLCKWYFFYTTQEVQRIIVSINLFLQCF